MPESEIIILTDRKVTWPLANFSIKKCSTCLLPLAEVAGLAAWHPGLSKEELHLRGSFVIVCLGEMVEQKEKLQ